jgi:hypothetical protein
MTEEVEEAAYSSHQPPLEACSVENRGREVVRKGEEEEEEEEEQEEEEEEGKQEVSLQDLSPELCEPYSLNISIHQY